MDKNPLSIQNQNQILNNHAELMRVLFLMYHLKSHGLVCLNKMKNP